MTLDRSSCYRALTARDPRFDGVFFVGVTSTRVYCRPVCRVKTPRAANCRYFSHPAAAERAGFRPCLRCRPELAPGTALVDATAQLAERATRAIAAGALNGASLEALADSLGVTARHLRRAVVGHVGVSPIDLATTHRLLLAKRLLHETTLPVAHVAYAAGFESLRRFNASFKGRYRLSPGALRRAASTVADADPPAAQGTVSGPRATATGGVAGSGAANGAANGAGGAGDATTKRRPVQLFANIGTGASEEVEGTSPDAIAVGAAMVELSLEYRPPLDWQSLLAFLAARATPGAEYVEDGRYVATVRFARSGTAGASRAAVSRADVIRTDAPRAGAPGARPPRAGALIAGATNGSKAADSPDEVVGHLDVALRAPRSSRARARSAAAQVRVRLSPSLLPVLMPLLARVRDLLDLDANPDAIARHLARVGVIADASDFGGIRIPGTLDSFALAVRAILGQQVSVKGATTVMGRLVTNFGELYAGADPRLTRLMPTAQRLAACSTGDIASLGMPAARADAVLALARAVAGGALDLAPGGDPALALRTLTALPGIGDWTAHYIAMRALRWPDAFPANDLVLRRAAGNISAAKLRARAEAWSPWRAYAAMQLWRSDAATQLSLPTGD